MPPDASAERCWDCKATRPVYTVGCPGCLADLVRHQERENWASAIDGILQTHGHKIAFQVRRRLGLPGI